MSRRVRVAVVAVVAMAGVAGCSGGVPQVDAVSDAHHVDFDYSIQPGTSARIDRGERVEVLPERLVARVGQVIRIRNRDVRGQTIGPFYVAPHTVMTQRFASPGRFVGRCTVHVSGTIRLVVRS
jgi:hypothetical protein